MTARKAVSAAALAATTVFFCLQATGVALPGGGAEAAQAPVPAKAKVLVEDNYFEPRSTEVLEGGVVVWKWRGAMEGNIMVSFDGAMPGNRTAVTLEETIDDPEAPLPGQALAHAEEMQGLRQAIAALPEKERVVLTLYYYEELNLRQIAEILHVTESRISQVRTQALKRLRNRLTERGDNG